jgi:hypothetical protein
VTARFGKAARSHENGPARCFPPADQTGVYESALGIQRLRLDGGLEATPGQQLGSARTHGP